MKRLLDDANQANFSSEEENEGSRDQPTEKNIKSEEIQLLKKIRVLKRQLTEADISGTDGLKRVYEQFPQICAFRGYGYEVWHMADSISVLLLFRRLQI